MNNPRAAQLMLLLKQESRTLFGAATVTLTVHVMMKRMKCSRSTVLRALRALRDAGLVQRISARGQVGKYKVASLLTPVD